jgi:SAM-dependent methyltransferase
MLDEAELMVFERSKTMSNDFTLKQFSAEHSVDTATRLSSYIDALEAFDGIEQLQELKACERERIKFAQGNSLLDVGCGFGLETLRYAGAISAKGKVAGIDTSADFIDEARRRATAAGLDIDFRVGDANALPYPEGSFDCVRAERILIYLEKPESAAQEMQRVLKAGGRLALIEPDFSITTINLSNRALVRRVIAHEVDTAVVQSWLPGPLLGILRALKFSDIQLATRVLIFPQKLCSSYFLGVGERAAKAGAISTHELEEWSSGIALLEKQGLLFGSIGYFLFTALNPHMRL